MRLQNAFAVVVLSLAGCGASDHAGPPAPAAAPAPVGSSPGKVFLADAANFAIASLIDPNPAPGIVTPDRVVAGPDTGLGTAGGTPSVSSIPGVALDALGNRLYVAKQASVLVFDQIGTANGDVAPTRVIQSAAGNHAVNFLRLHLAPGDVLYAVEPSGEVRVFNNASTLNGSVAPDRTITPDIGATINSASGVALDASRNMLYVGVATSSSSIVVFNNASSANATLAPDRTLNFSLEVDSFCLDAGRDILYVALIDGVILVFDKASMLATGIAVPNRLMTLQVPITTASSAQLFMALDSVNNRLYAVNGNSVFIVNGASAADDPLFGATRITMSTASSLLSAIAVVP